MSIERVEMEQGMRDMAASLRVFHVALVDEGFAPPDALRLTLAYITGVARGARGSDDD